MKLYNTMTNKIEEFKTIEENKVKMYVCGPTVYNYIHLGNARPIVVFDTLARYFKYKGMEVNYVQNFTDVDDKIINKSMEEGTSASEVSEKYIKCFFEDINRLNILESVKRPKVTENMAEIIEIIQKLIDNGFAYEKDGDVYFEVKKYKDYGKLSNQKIEELELGARIDVSEIKKNPMDFALWKKKKKEGELFWESPWGQGRPGWHIECSGIAIKNLGEYLDIPVRYYSSGMFIRLAFSVSTSVDPDILLLDEVLAAGDAGFVDKANKRINEMMKSAKILVLVTHSMESAIKFCNKAILLKRGEILKFGTPTDVVDYYLKK